MCQKKRDEWNNRTEKEMTATVTSLRWNAYSKWPLLFKLTALSHSALMKLNILSYLWKLVCNFLSLQAQGGGLVELGSISSRSLHHELRVSLKQEGCWETTSSLMNSDWFRVWTAQVLFYWLITHVIVWEVELADDSLCGFLINREGFSVVLFVRADCGDLQLLQ